VERVYRPGQLKNSLSQIEKTPAKALARGLSQARLFHARGSTVAFAPSRTVFFVEVTNQSRGSFCGIAAPPSPTQMAFWHNRREHFLMAASHIESLSGTGYTNVAADRGFERDARVKFKLHEPSKQSPSLPRKLKPRNAAAFRPLSTFHAIFAPGVSMLFLVLALVWILRLDA
jgi:hypothetical protein